MSAPTTPQVASQVRNVVANWGAFAVAAIAGLYLSPRVVTALGPSAYGVWVLIGSLIGPLGLLDFGVRSAITRLIARHAALGEHDEASRMASSARILYAITGSVALLVSAGLALGLVHWFNVPAEFGGTAPLVLVVAGLSLAIALSTGLYGGILAGLRRIDLVGISGIVIEFLRVPIILLVLWAGGGLLGLAAVGLLLAAARFWYQRGAAARVYPELHLTLFRPHRRDLAAIMEISLFSTVIYSLGTVTSQMSVYVIGATLPLTMVTFYAIGGTLPQYVQAMSLPVAQNLLPQASHLEATGGDVALRALVLDSGRFGALVVLPMVLAFITRGPTFLGIWMGPEYREGSGPVLVVLSLLSVFSLARHVLQTAFVGTGRHRRLVPWYLAEAATTLVLTVVFVRLWGVLGAAWALVIPSLMMAAVVFPVLTSMHFGIPVRVQWTGLWLRPLAALAPYAFASWATDRLWPASGYLTFFLQVGALLPLAALGAWTVGISSGERRAFRESAKARLRDVGRIARRRT